MPPVLAHQHILLVYRYQCPNWVSLLDKEPGADAWSPADRGLAAPPEAWSGGNFNSAGSAVLHRGFLDVVLSLLLNSCSACLKSKFSLKLFQLVKSCLSSFWFFSFHFLSNAFHSFVISGLFADKCVSLHLPKRFVDATSRGLQTWLHSYIRKLENYIDKSASEPNHIWFISNLWRTRSTSHNMFIVFCMSLVSILT